MDEIVFVGDVHLERDDAALAAFLDYLDALGRRTRRVVLMGDLFDVWLGRAATESSRHRAVLEVLRGLRRNGTWVGYLEGNRDYRVGERHEGGAFDRCAEAAWETRVAGRSILAFHGHGLHPGDRSYRRWHRFSRSAPVWGTFHLLPRAIRRRASSAIERRMRGSNLRFKGRFPEEIVLRWAESRFARGIDDVVLGHFHVERLLDAGEGRRVWVLPEWKGSRRHLRVGADGAIAFEDA